MPALSIPNNSFETGDLTSWLVVEGGNIGVGSDFPSYDGQYAMYLRGGSGNYHIEHSTFFDVIPGDTVSATMWLNPTRGSDRGHLRVYWYGSGSEPIGYTEGNQVVGGGDYRASSLSNVLPPAGATRFRFAVMALKYTSSHFGADYLTASLDSNTSIRLVAPADGSEWGVGDSVQMRADVTTQADVTSVGFYLDGALYGSVASPPYTFNYLDAEVGTHEIFARLTVAGGVTVDSNTVEIEVLEDPPEPVTREFDASNAYTQLILENFSGLSSQIPSTAQVTGMEVLVDYKMSVLSRTKDLDSSDIPNANDLVPFDIVSQVDVEASFIDSSGDLRLIGVETQSTEVIRSDFSVVEEGISGNRKWVVREGATVHTLTFGGEAELWGDNPIAFPDFVNRAIGLRFIPRVGEKPAYTDSGNAVFRFFVDRVRLRVYFNAGSVEYYFASPDKTQVIKGIMTSNYVMEGNLVTGDASGVMQLSPNLEVIDGTQTWIGEDWTIHSAYPPTDGNQIADVSEREYEDGLGLAYNRMPTQSDIIRARSRYMFISSNFYGDKDWDSIYGANGVDRAFSYNGEYFYNIYTQPDLEKDKPRHIANHHSHLALGYDQGRVDLSVVGEPYNFDGTMGASSWAVGDQIVGLLPLPGMILGIFGAKSVHGLAGTTVDNFATQVISAKRGAIEYTIADMGYPVYASSYGIYTLNQVQQYGDYMGTPMSDPISPWFKDRLLRKYTSDKEVVCAWPVRSKNQYRLAFRDGFVASMTMDDTKGYPTFSFLKYFITPPDESPDLGIPLDTYPTIYPIALSSELDDSGEERIHVANIQERIHGDPPDPDPEPGEWEVHAACALGSGNLPGYAFSNGSVPDWFLPESEEFNVVWSSGQATYEWSSEIGSFILTSSSGSVVEYPDEVVVEVSNSQGSFSAEVLWNCA